MTSPHKMVRVPGRIMVTTSGVDFNTQIMSDSFGGLLPSIGIHVVNHDSSSECRDFTEGNKDS